MARKTQPVPAAATPTAPSAPSARLDPDVAPAQARVVSSSSFIKNHGKTILIAAAVLLTIVVVAAIVKGHPSQQPSSSVSAEKALPTLSMPANGDSPRLPTKPGHAISYTGSGFILHCVYRDWSEGIDGDPVRPCKNGPMLEQYVHDTTGKPNSVTYEFVRQK